MAVSREPSPPITMPHSIQSYQGSSADGGDTESVMSDLSWDGTPDENILSGSSRAATSLAIHEEDEGDPSLRFLDDPDGDDTLIMEDDAYRQLGEMEEKLKMAGEFGNALLEENQELRLLHQQIQQETSAKIEALEQERHELRMKLETARTEKENVSYDLRMEVESLRKELADRGAALQVANSNKQGIIGELMDQNDQNQKLAGQLQEMRRERDSVHDRLKLVEKQNESISLFHHQSSLGKSEQLRAEASALRDENGKLREQLITVSSEHETMMSNLEEAKERNMMLEKQVMEVEQRLQFRETELRDLNRMHEETLQELGTARSRANTHCSSSLYDELETAELTGYESSEEDCEVDNKADVMMSRFMDSRGMNRQTSLAQELAASLGAMESPSPHQRQQQHLQQTREMNAGGDMSGVDRDRTRHPSVGRQLSLAEEFAELDNSSTPRHQSGYVSEEKSQHHRRRGVGEPLHASSPRQHQRSLSLQEEMQSQQEVVHRVKDLDEANGAEGNILSLADELSQASVSSNTLVGMAFEEEHFGSQDNNRKKRNGFILGDDDEEEDEEKDREGMMVGVMMASQFPNQGLSLADELAGLGYQQGQGDDEEEEENIDDEEEVIVQGSHSRGGEMVAIREREGGGDRIDAEDDDVDVTSLDTPKATPVRSPRTAELHLKYRQIEDVLHWVHVALSHIILELHSLVRLPLTDLGIMHASTVLHSVHPSHHHHTPGHSWPMIGSDVEIEDDDDEGDDVDDEGDGVAKNVGDSDHHDNQRSEMIGEKVKSQLGVLRSMLSIVVNGSPKLASPDLNDCVIQIDEEDPSRRRSRNITSGQPEDNVMASTRGRVTSPDRQGVDIHHPMDETGEDIGWQAGMQELMDDCTRHSVTTPTSSAPADQQTSGFSARSQSAPDFGRRNQFGGGYWS